MIEKIANQIICYQVKHNLITKEEQNLYKYGYTVLIEYIINIIAAILIAVVFKAYGIMIVFSLAYIFLRSYAGGYHAKTSFGCFCMSAGMFVLAIVLISGLAAVSKTEYLFLLEMIMIPYIFRRIPIPVKNKPLSENERKYFGRRTKLFYILEILIGLIFLFSNKEQLALSVLLAHMVIFLLVFRNQVNIQIHKRDKSGFEN